MADWGAALAGGIGAAASSGAESIGNQIKQQQQYDAEVRAANLQLDIKQRLQAADQMMQARAMEKFNSYLKPGAGAAPTDAPGASMPAAASGVPGPGAPAGAQAGAAPAAAPGKWSDAVKSGLQYAAVNDPTTYAVASKLLEPMLEREAKEAETTRKGKHDDDTLALDRDKYAETGRHNKASEDIDRIKANKDPSGTGAGASPADAKMIEYLVKQGMDRQSATDRVLGTGAGATKDPVGLAVQLASSMISNGQVRVSKDDPPGTTVASKAMEMATGQVQSATANLRTPVASAKPSPTPAAAAKPGTKGSKPANDPLGLFK